MQYKGAVFFDYDGTLTDENAGIGMPTEATRRAIRELRKNGYLAVLATGRGLPYIYDTGIEFDGMSTSNGTYGVVAGEVVFDHPIEEDAMVRLTARMDELGVNYGIDNPEICLTPDTEERRFLTWINTFDIKPSSFRSIAPGEKVKGYKLCALFESYDQIEQLRAEFGEEFEFACQRVFKYADVNIRAYNKATGVRAICEHFGLNRENTYAFGDGSNDYDMLKCVGHGIAMGHHAEELESCAEFITKTVSEEGIEWGLKHYGLI
ncbi:MAG: HAD-IIB family hydrolase [Clostridia bacterium]|nr:HAD-IIB family hydrolase [Clostridia bacterium]